jgi:hypothetical protein
MIIDAREHPEWVGDPALFVWLKDSGIDPPEGAFRIEILDDAPIVRVHRFTSSPFDRERSEIIEGRYRRLPPRAPMFVRQ